MATGLSLKERRFVDAYLGSCNGNATAAALEAGYSRNRKSAAVLGLRLLRKVKVQAVLEKRRAAEEQQSIADAKERDIFMSTVLRDKTADLGHRLSAGKELNKCDGRHSMRHEVGLDDDLYELLGGRPLPKAHDAG